VIEANGSPRSEGFGARLRQRREQRQIDLVAIASQTKINVALLEALERDDVSHWPSGIFRRAYIRAYAEFIGLDPDVVLREFQQLHPEAEDTSSTLAAAADAAKRNAPPPTRLRIMVDSAIGSLARLRPAAADPVPPAALPSPGKAGPAAEDAPRETPPSPVVAADVAPADAGANAIGRDDPASAESAVEALEALALLCTELGRAVDRGGIQRLLHESAAALKATGLVVWLWDESAGGLKPALVHGYSERVVAHLPTVKRDADNATAAAFRSASPREIAAKPQTSGALAMPLLLAEGCAGVLAIEVPEGVQLTKHTRAAAALLAASLAQLVRRFSGTTSSAKAGRTDRCAQEMTIDTHDAAAREPYRIRKGALDDVEAVARIWLTGWADGHVGHVPPALVPHRQDPAQYVSRARDRVDSTWVAESASGEILGFVVVKRDELEQVYVDRAARGTGVAAQLLRRGEDEVRRNGHSRAWLAVVAGNARARAFYERQGWRDAGPFTYHAETEEGSFPVPSHRYEIALNA